MIGAVVLAAGESRRMGEPKPLLEIGGQSILDRVLAAVRNARVEETVLVVGAAADRLRSHLPAKDVRVVLNPEFARGMSTSMRVGVHALTPRVDRFFLVLGDQPFVTSATLNTLIDVQASSGAKIVIPTYRGIRGNPVLLDRSLEEELDSITGDRGCRAIHDRYPNYTREVAVDDPGVLVDVDTPEDLARARDALARGGSVRELADRAAEARGAPLPGAGTGAPSRVSAPVDILALAQELRARGETFALGVVVHVDAPTSGKPGYKAIVRADGSTVGWVGGSCTQPVLIEEALGAMADGQPRLVQLAPETGSRVESAGRVERAMACDSGGRVDIYIEPFRPPPMLVLVGDTPVIQALSAYGRILGHRVVVVAPGADPSRFPNADEFLDTIDGLGARAGADSFAVVATMAKYDGIAVRELAESPAPYVGLVASRTRSDTLFAQLRAEGADPKALARVRTPAGIDIAARSPEEIALAVMAEVTKLRRTATPAAATPTPLPVVPARSTAVDPVCGMTVETTTPLRASQGGTMYYFCADGCRARFVAHPEQFLAKA